MAGTGEMLWKLRTGAGWLWQRISLGHEQRSVHPTPTRGSDHRLPKDPSKTKQRLQGLMLVGKAGMQSQRPEPCWTLLCL